MRIRDHWLPLAFLLAVLAVIFVSGCGKYENLERNMQYVSDDLLHRDAQAAWETLKAAHDRWSSAGFNREKDNEAFVAYSDAYDRYAIIYNELASRQGGSPTASLRGLSNELPPPPPGGGNSGKNAPAPTASSSETTAPMARELDAGTSSTPGDLPKAAPLTPAAPSLAPGSSVAPAAPAPTAESKVSPDQGRYVIKSGDSLRSIAKRHGLTEKKLMDANGLTDPDKIAAGKTLIIPAP